MVVQEDSTASRVDRVNGAPDLIHVKDAGCRFVLVKAQHGWHMGRV
jgi:hypothetical protein